jgi:DNA-binding MarR family transcriptional regulator
MTTAQIKAARRHSLSTTAILALLTLHQDQCASLGTLASECEVTTAAVTHLADFLVNKEFAIRECVPGDRRSIRLTLTPAGIALVAEITEPAAA